jgi:hypothetical protein
MAEELNSTVLLDGVEYNINAETANTAKQVANALTVKKINLNKSDGSVNTDSEERDIFGFDGSEAKSITVVPAEGGRFTGRITVPSLKTSGPINRDGETVLNCNDIKEYIVNELQNSSVLYTWEYDQDTKTGTLTGGGLGTAVQSICIIYGASEDVEPFAEYNHAAYIDYTENNNVDASFMAAFIYISDDTEVSAGDDPEKEYIGNIYFGTCEQPTTVPVRATADRANRANIAEALETACSFQVDLAKNTAVTYKGDTEDLDLGVMGVLKPENGGTGKTSLSDVTVGKANIVSGYDSTGNLRETTAAALYAKLEQANLDSQKLTEVINGTIPVHTATTAQAIAVYTLNSSTGTWEPNNRRKIFASTSEPSNDFGNTYDIWIQHS